MTISPAIAAASSALPLLAIGSPFQVDEKACRVSRVRIVTRDHRLRGIESIHIAEFLA